MARNITPDIIGDIMGVSKPENNKALKQDSNTTSEPSNTKTLKPENNKALKQDSNTTSEPSNTKTLKPENNKALKQDSNTTSEPSNTKTLKPENNKEKATFNMSADLLESLDEAWFRLKRMTKNKDRRVTKTLIVETSLKKYLDDFNKNLENSELFEEITKKAP